MKTPLLTALVSCAFVLGAQAQPIINMADVTPVFGDVVTQSGADYTDVGAAGANQTWDFSYLIPLGSTISEVVDPALQPDGDEFPTATVASKVVGDDQTAYARFAENKSEFIGISIPSSDILMFYPNPRTQIEFPLTYQNTFTDTYQRTADFGGGASNVENGTISTVVDGYGTIITPAGTYENVLRIKEISEGTLEVYVNGMLVNSSPFNGTSYSYVKAGYSTAILSISIFTFAGETTNSLVYSVSGGSVGIAEVNPFQEVKVFPSPAVDYVNVAYTLEKTTDVALKLIGLDGRLVANLGESQRPSGKNQFRLNLPEVAAGIYLLQISTPDGQTTERIAIQ